MAGSIRVSSETNAVGDKISTILPSLELRSYSIP